MQITIKPHIEAYLREQVSSGRFASIEQAIEALALDDEATQSDLDAADLTWAKPYIDKGLDDLAAGRVVPANEVHAELRRKFGSGS